MNNAPRGELPASPVMAAAEGLTDAVMTDAIRLGLTTGPAQVRQLTGLVLRHAANWIESALTSQQHDGTQSVTGCTAGRITQIRA